MPRAVAPACKSHGRTAVAYSGDVNLGPVGMPTMSLSEHAVLAISIHKHELTWLVGNAFPRMQYRKLKLCPHVRNAPDRHKRRYRSALTPDCCRMSQRNNAGSTQDAMLEILGSGGSCFSKTASHGTLLDRLQLRSQLLRPLSATTTAALILQLQLQRKVPEVTE